MNDHRAVVAERRQLTVLFCDLVGSTALADEMDPEAFRELILAYQKAVSEVVTRYTGYIAQYLGDGMLVYFGYPRAQDDDAERAVRCGFDVLRALDRFDRQPSLKVRIGIHTGPVVVGATGGEGRSETLAMGATINLASRLQGLAEPHSVLLSATTLKLVPGLFVTKDLGAQKLKGSEQPLVVHQLVQPSGVRTRLEAAEKLTPFVGRAQELALLNERWLQAGEGQGQAVLLTAEPGLGKSRLLLSLREQIRESKHTWLDCRCAPLTKDSAFAPTIELLARGLQLRESDTNEVRAQRLGQALDALGFDRNEAMPLLAPLLNLNLPKGYAPSPYGPELKRRKVLELLAGFIVALARHQPLVLAVEDLHWADPSSLDLLALVIEQIASAPVFVIFTARPEFQPTWPMWPHLAMLALQPLRARETGSMLGTLTGNRALPAAVQERILRQAGGVPLFVEELTKAVLESGQLIEKDGRLELAGRLEDLAIPSTLQDSLAARIDRLGDARSLIQLCAVAGREIPYKLLVHVADMDEASLQKQLATLTGTQLLYARGSPPEATYLFKHALIQDVAYESLLRSARQHLHGRIADTYEKHFAEIRQGAPEVLALHFDKAQQCERAIRYYTAAADKAVLKMANRESLAHVDRALNLLATLPAGAARDALELPLALTRASGHSVLSGFSHQDTRAAAQRLGELVNDASDAMTQVRSLSLLWVSHHFSAEFATGLKYAERLVERGRALRTPAFEGMGYSWSAMSKQTLGRFTEAVEAAQRALPLGDLATGRAISVLGGADPHGGALGILSTSHWILGYPDQALAYLQAWQDRMRLVDVPLNTCAQKSTMTMLLSVMRRPADEVLETATSVLLLCQQYGHAYGAAYASRSVGAALCRLGRYDEGLAAMRQSIVDLRAAGQLGSLPNAMAPLAEHCLACGRIAEARAVMDELMEYVRQYDYGWWGAELLRVDARVRLAQGEVAKAGSIFRTAIDVARRQQARSWELRAATSYARMLQQQGRRDEARDLVAPVYAWFTEGFATPDLVDAKALLEQLA